MQDEITPPPTGGVGGGLGGWVGGSAWVGGWVAWPVLRQPQNDPPPPPPVAKQRSDLVAVVARGYHRPARGKAVAGERPAHLRRVAAMEPAPSAADRAAPRTAHGTAGAPGGSGRWCRHPHPPSLCPGLSTNPRSARYNPLPPPDAGAGSPRRLQSKRCAAVPSASDLLARTRSGVSTASGPKSWSLLHHPPQRPGAPGASGADPGAASTDRGRCSLLTSNRSGAADNADNRRPVDGCWQSSQGDSILRWQLLYAPRGCVPLLHTHSQGVFSGAS